MATVGFIGAGRMGSALIRCMAKSGLAGSIMASDKEQERLRGLGAIGVSTTTDSREVVRRCDAVFLCVKPQDMAGLLDAIRGEARPGQLFISIAAGIPLSFLEGRLPGKFVRVMPNIGCLKGEMAAAYCPGRGLSKADIELARKLLEAGGMAIRVEEGLLDAVTALSGSGPAFFASFTKGLVEGAVREGLPKDVATLLAAQTAIATGRLIKDGLSPEEITGMVASQGGTTVAGLKVFEESRLMETLERAISEAAKRSRELRQR